MNNTSDISLIYLPQAPASKIDFEHQLQRLRQGFEQQTMSGKVVTPLRWVNREIDGC